MSQAVEQPRRRLLLAALAGLASFVFLSGIFVTAMHVQYRAIDVQYLLFAMLRIAAMSLVTAGVTALVSRYLRTVLLAVIFGAAAGLLLAVVYVNAVTAN